MPTQALPPATDAPTPGRPSIVTPTNTPPSVLSVTPTGEVGPAWANDGIAVATTAAPRAAAMTRRRMNSPLRVSGGGGDQASDARTQGQSWVLTTGQMSPLLKTMTP